MVLTIGPVVYGRSHRRDYRNPLHAAVFMGSMIATSSFVGFVVSIMTLPLRELLPADSVIASTLLSAVSVLVALDNVPMLSRFLPGPSWQVPRFWILRFPAPVWQALFGAYLGVGILTKLPIKTHYVLIVAFALLSPPAAAVVGVIFGASRGLTILLAAQWLDLDGRVMNMITSRPNGLALLNATLLGLIAGFLVGAPSH